MSMNVFVNNLTNRTNLMGYSGVETSPFYRKPTMAQGARRIQAEHEPGSSERTRQETEPPVCSLPDDEWFQRGRRAVVLEPVDAFADQIELQQVVAGRLRRDDLDGHVDAGARLQRLGQPRARVVALEQRAVLVAQLRAEPAPAAGRTAPWRETAAPTRSRLAS